MKALPSDYQTFIATSRYSRWIEDQNRREFFPESVRRYFSYFEEKFPWLIDEPDWKAAEQEYLNLGAVGSMRSLMTAGKALERDHVAGYNCSYTAVDHPRVFDEIMYILLCGTGVGFSVERQYVQKLPEVPEEFHETDSVIVVSDSKIGWASAYRELIAMLYSGKVPKWDTSKIRPAGSRLKTFGGRASGPDPLIDLFQFTVEVFRKAAGRKLQSLEVHDVVCKIADIVVVGGVRRSALISLSNLTDERMRNAKSGQWWEDNPQRALANNSVCYTERPDIGIFMKEWSSLYESKSGERGIFNREAAQNLVPERRKDAGYTDFGTNPCSEIVLRSGQFCNLTEVVARPDDTMESLIRKVKLATILGTVQATLTNFRYLRSHWKKNTEEEALLGVSITGIMDHPVLSGSKTVSSSILVKSLEKELPTFKPGSYIPVRSTQNVVQIDTKIELEKWLQELKEVAIATNIDWANKLGINPSSAITCVKPSGTVSQLVDSASGIHARHSNYYIRTVRTDKKDPMYQFLKDQGVPVEDAIGKESSTAVFSFPIKSPEGAITRNEMTAIEQLEIWKVYALNWCEHKPSVTVTVREHEWMDVGAWVYQNFDICSGVSFLPHTDHVYRQAPYQECTKEEYEEALSKMPENIDWEGLSEYEKEDTTTGTQELACSSGSCEII